MKRTLVAALLCVGSIGTVGVTAAAQEGTSVPAAPAAATAYIKAIDNTFNPESTTVAVGQKVLWENRGRNEHNIVPVDDAQLTEWGEADPKKFGPKQTYEHSFTKPGTYSYYCSLHGTKTKGMVGKVTVTESSTPAAGSIVESSTPAAGSGAPSVSTVIHVPADQPTIQAGVDAAKPGDLVLIAPGTYNEAVNVVTDQLTIRGEDRNTVILDGKLEMDNGIRVLKAKGVAVENMTAMNYRGNGFFWTGVDGYRGSYLTAYRTGDYGIYAFDSTNGQLEHSYAAGSPDAGVYIGECYPCNAVIDDLISEHNGLGYSGTNSGGNLLIVNSIFRNNRAGVVPNSGSYELCYPSRGTTIVGNLVYSNNQPDTPAIDVAQLAMGNGILLAGAVRADIERNLVYDHDKSGIGLVPFLEEDPNDQMPAKADWELTCAEQKAKPVVQPEGVLLWNAEENHVVGNVLENNRQADLLVAAIGDTSTLGNCWQGNVFTSSSPKAIEQVAPCEGTGTGNYADGAYDIGTWLAETHPPSVDWKTANLPPLTVQPNMPDALTAPAHPAIDVPFHVDLAAIKVPAKPAA